jgi:hypothetical protein
MKSVVVAVLCTNCTSYTSDGAYSCLFCANGWVIYIYMNEESPHPASTFSNYEDHDQQGKSGQQERSPGWHMATMHGDPPHVQGLH